MGFHLSSPVFFLLPKTCQWTGYDKFSVELNHTSPLPIQGVFLPWYRLQTAVSVLNLTDNYGHYKLVNSYSFI